jgi:type III restriction enzyme
MWVLFTASRRFNTTVKNVRARRRTRYELPDNLGFEITYSYKGVIRKYRPDYLVRLTNGTTLVLEVKGQDNQEHQTKRKFLGEWVRAVNNHGGFGTWAADVSTHPADIYEILAPQGQQ